MARKLTPLAQPQIAQIPVSKEWSARERCVSYGVALRFSFSILVALAALAVSGCQSFKKEEKTASPPPVARETFLGTVSSVNENGRFVLVDFGGFTAPAPASELEARRAGVVVATLKAGSEMRRPFAAADILSGEPQEGDDVWSKNP